MATTPDSHPDSLPAGPSEDVEQVSPTADPGRESIEDTPDGSGGYTGGGASYGTHDGSPLDPPGVEDGVSGSAGLNKSQEDVTS